MPGYARWRARRLAYTGLRRPEVEGLLRETGDSAARENYRIRKEYAADRLRR